MSGLKRQVMLVLDQLMKIVLVCGLVIARWRNCQCICNYWFCKWVGAGKAFNPNRDYLEKQLMRPMDVLNDFILEKELDQFHCDGWQYIQYMAYLAKIIEKGDLSFVYSLDSWEIVLCCRPVVAARLGGVIGYNRLVPGRYW